MDQPTVLLSLNQLKKLWENVQQSYHQAMTTKEHPDVVSTLTLIDSFKHKKRSIYQQIKKSEMELTERTEIERELAQMDNSLLKQQQKELKKLPYYERLSSLEELSTRNWFIMPQHTTTVSNFIGEKLKEVGISSAELAKRTGNSRQALSFITKNQPCTLTTALKISQVLNVPVEELFHLTKEAWYVSPLNNGATTLYLNLQTLELMENVQKREQIKKTNYLYWHEATKRALTSKEIGTYETNGTPVVSLYQEIGTAFVPVSMKKGKK